MSIDGESVGKAHDVTVVGCGLMGAALARTFARSGLSVAVWNRTAEKAEALASERIEPVRDIAHAVTSAPLVVSCLLSYDATTEALDPVADWTGVTLVNVASGSPTEVAALDRWAAGRGARHLDGALICYPDDIGTSEAAVLYSGSAQAWEEHQGPLLILAESSLHVSEQVTVASVLNVGLIGAFFVPALSAYVEAVTYALDNGVTPEMLGLLSQVSLEKLHQETTHVAQSIASGDHASNQATVDTYLEAARPALDVLRGAGQHGRVLAAAVANLRAAADAGLGGQGFGAQSRTAATAPRPGDGR
ncbi:3-hydroxyisobutyrate dehydrogenase-like beta-hydroxyacid dehydrogenase [Actinopolyspora biskrensis]|uniref:3-hydroxyisobutyrate dehydrogenase-like beta-hydroxyacid dehydrogenase n=1 Tax=Actinopolyspora biskrensis TaxID=1470178 RepID=A0A852YTN2_9ACTN|nr:NAD(P)-binding domain-containing protein [Actinopolyspora biskrensis]NYH77308.1 3-hydroxyisobutyrate dehydrogenase-like beta-hydroxyacid dehydrogenase [Actinopolyspora biskrensis]